MNKFLFSILGIALIFVSTLILVNQYNTRNFAQTSFLEIEKKYSYKIERDQFGVPHVYGDTDKDAAFGFAYAQAEDDLKHVEMMIKMSRGELSSLNFNSKTIAAIYSLITGDGDIMENLDAIEGVELDFLFKFFNVQDTVNKKISEIPKETIN